MTRKAVCLAAALFMAALNSAAIIQSYSLIPVLPAIFFWTAGDDVQPVRADVYAEYTAIVEREISLLLKGRLDGKFRTVSHPTGFHYGITYGTNAYYNKAALVTMDSLVKTGQDGKFILDGSFSSLYYQLLSSIDFELTGQDRQILDEKNAAIAVLAEGIIKEYTNAGFSFSVSGQPGGKLQEVFDRYEQLAAEYGGGDKLPPRLGLLRNAINKYELLVRSSLVLYNRWREGTARLDAARAHVENPGASNGGQQTDGNEYYAGYTPDKLPGAATLLHSLNTESNKITIKIHVKNTPAQTIAVFDTGASFSIPHTAAYPAQLTDSNETISIEISYTGITVIQVSPSELSVDRKTGWYDAQIVYEAVHNRGTETSGYRFIGSEFDIPDYFGEGKLFARLKTFVISRNPVVRIKMETSNTTYKPQEYSRAYRTVEAVLSAVLPEKHGYRVKLVDYLDNGQSNSIEFEWTDSEDGGVPLEQQTAFILGGVVAYPPDGM
jgi:hypothetical protein